jgi:ArsR family transcriptional regulator, arsenate/arsenite/antimonite-responsive transcriptional repressor
MGLTKTDNFTLEQNELAQLAKAIGHPARVAIIEYLVQQDNCVCGNIVEAIPLAQATVSQHLKELKNAGLITGSVEGNAICYCIDGGTWKKFQNLLKPIFDKAESPVCC